MTTHSTYGIAGLNCNGCVNTLTKKVTTVDGVQSVDVALVSGGTSQLTVTFGAPLDDYSMRAALSTLGYTPIDLISV
jgi:copper chaperone CopZ